MKANPQNCILWFACQMDETFMANSHKTGWQNLTMKQSLKRIKDEVRELEEAINTKNKSGDDIIHECTDVANFAMFLACKASDLSKENDNGR